MLRQSDDNSKPCDCVRFFIHSLALFQTIGSCKFILWRPVCIVLFSVFKTVWVKAVLDIQRVCLSVWRHSTTSPGCLSEIHFSIWFFLAFVSHCQFTLSPSESTLSVNQFASVILIPFVPVTSSSYCQSVNDQWLRAFQFSSCLLPICICNSSGRQSQCQCT